MIKEEERLKKVLYLDFSLALAQSASIINQDTKEDALLMQSSNSLHNKYNPYLAYIMKNHKLYRLESLKPLSYPLSSESEFSVDYLGEANSFRVYKSDANTSSELFLIHVDFKEQKDVLLKIKALNQN